MNSGKCLCDSLTWNFTGEPEHAYHCHCKMCRKLHGATFATFYTVSDAQFEWTSNTDSWQEYTSSEALSRAFCNECGSAVPARNSEGGGWFVPAGSHQSGPAITQHIFADDVAPWHSIEDDLPQHAAYPEGSGIEPLPTQEPDPIPEEIDDSVVRGSCQCGAVAFHVMTPFKVIHHCHCSRCREARAAAHTTNGFTSINDVNIYRGKEHIRVYKVPDAKFFTHAFCDICGSGVPRLDEARGIAVTPVGSLDDDPGTKPADHIFTGSKADWYEIKDDLPQFEEMPG
ncbi:MAG: GFA family protein [Acidiferrobacterales bacterium]|nr:GFA family protein [Acidiferrobacterales bacterium]